MKAFWKGEYLCEWSGMPSIPEARVIKKITGMLPEPFGESLEKGDPDAWAMLVKILLKRAGRDVRLEEVDGDYGDLRMEKTESEKQKEAEKQVDEVNPVIKKILLRLDVAYDDASVREIVLDELRKAQDEGKDEPSDAQPSNGQVTDGAVLTSMS